jgi:phosphoribosylglycinamide formyltransferase-1
MNAPLAVGIIISGRGSNMLAIARACAAGRVNARIVCVIADRDGAAGIAAASELGLRTAVLPASQFPDREAFEKALARQLDACGAGLVVLAGFMRILTPWFVNRYAGRLLNIHPSLLPAYPGLHTHQRVLAAGDRVHGVTVHYVTAQLDGGPAVRQACVPVLPGDDESKLSARVQAQEHMIYPEVIGWIAAGRLQWREAGPMLDGAPLRQPVVTGANVHATT